MRRLVLIFLATLALCASSGSESVVRNDLGYREAREEKKLREEVEAIDRFVDAGVLLKVVVRDDEHGAELLDGKPKLRVIREHRFGGMIDTRSSPPQRCGPSKNPVTWFCSEDQEQILLHNDPKVPGQLIYGSEGAGKTRVLAMLHYLWWLECIGEGREVGQTAPTKRRMKMVLEAMVELYPKQWYSYVKNEHLVTFCDGHRVQLVSTKRTSEAQGSPVQGYNWSKAARDELQDQTAEDFDIESRGRSAKHGIYHQAATCTAKQSAAFRTLVQRKLGSGKWIKRVLLIARSPFISPAFLEERRLVMTDREFRRRYLAEDLPPELALYYNWNRELHLRRIPHNAKRITSRVIRVKKVHPRADMLAGHDPGVAKCASIFLDAYEIKNIVDPVWWVRGELFERGVGTEQHARNVLAIGRDRWGLNLRDDGGVLHVRAHPYGQSEDKPDLDVYRLFQKVGLDIKAAQYKKDGTGTGRIAKESRIEMVNALLLDATGRTRLYVDIDSVGNPVAPHLVDSFETMERDEEGKAETEKKNELDRSDPPCALGYGLWPFEKQTAQLARARDRRE